jgi:hypothetical protein
MPPMTISEGSSAISDTRKDIVLSRDGGLCVLCGMSPIDIAHIIARKSWDPAVSLYHFSKTAEFNTLDDSLTGSGGPAHPFSILERMIL